MDKLSYALGLNMGLQFQNMNLSGKLVVEDFAAAVGDIMQGRQPQVSVDEAQTILSDFFDNLEKEHQAAAEQAGKAAKAEAPEAK